MKITDRLLNKVSMYRLVIYYLAGTLTLAIILSAAQVLPYNPWHIVSLTIYLAAVCITSNIIFARLAGTKMNLESALITSLILALIFGPQTLTGNFALFAFIAFAAMASKYLVVWQRRHIFNPAAFAAVAAAILFGQGATWWVGSIYLLPIIAAGGILLMRKISRWPLIFSFLGSYFALIIIFNIQAFNNLNGLINFSWGLLAYTSILFFAFVMLVEPQTSPNRRVKRIWYGAFTAAALALLQNYTGIFYSLELALLAGNVFAFIVSYEVRTNLKLAQKEQIAPNIYNFWFKPKHKLNFSAGQFLEWTLYHKAADNRGIRRYFTIASSPTEDSVLLTTKFAQNGSTFKTKLQNMNVDDQIIATGPEGDFVLPKDLNQKLVFIAGGIGITPFRSMIKYCLDKKEQRNIVMIYAAKSEQEFVFQELFARAQDELNLKLIYTTDLIDRTLIEESVVDLDESIFFASGPEPMVKQIEKNLMDIGIKTDKIKHDYFPGYEEI